MVSNQSLLWADICNQSIQITKSTSRDASPKSPQFRHLHRDCHKQEHYTTLILMDGCIMHATTDLSFKGWRTPWRTSIVRRRRWPGRSPPARNLGTSGRTSMTHTSRGRRCGFLLAAQEHTTMSDPSDEASIYIERQGYLGMSDPFPHSVPHHSTCFSYPPTTSTAAWP
jgi:hypothetical protein